MGIAALLKGLPVTGLYVWIATDFTLCLIGALLMSASAPIEDRTILGTFCPYTFVYMMLKWLVVAGGLITAFLWSVTYRNDHWVTCHVTNKDKGENGRSYRIYTSDCGELSNEDSWLRGKSNSDAVWQEIPTEGAVRFRIAGSKLPFISLPNIFDVQPAS
jgi:hypothetical protein